MVVVVDGGGSGWWEAVRMSRTPDRGGGWWVDVDKRPIGDNSYVCG